jgi:uncharacterized membrane protein YgcG
VAAGEAFSFIAQQRIDSALHGFRDQTGLVASVYVGTTDDNGLSIDAFADRALAELPAHREGTVLIVVDPGRRQSVIRTDPTARHRVTDASCALATLSMTTSFGAGDLVGGVVVGLRMLGDACAPPTTSHGRPEATSSTATYR